METNHATNKIKALLLAGALVLAGALSACQPYTMQSCTVVPYKTIPAGSDYVGGNPGKWIAQDADGSDAGVLGYAQEEDSIIYTTRACAVGAKTYHV